MSLLFVLPLVALAQEREPSREYLFYEQALNELDIAWPTDPSYQLDWGVTGLVDLSGEEIGLTVTTGDSPRLERWFFYDQALAPHEGFAFQFVCHGATPGCFAQIEAEVEPLENKPAYNISVEYKDIPPKPMTDPLVLWTGEIDFYTFVLKNHSNQVVGHLLREVHHQQNPIKYVDHWVFKANYAWPSANNPKVWVSLAATQYPHAAAFFEAVGGQPGKYAKPVYTQVTGAQTAPF
jgi:hypothetical protein